MPFCRKCGVEISDNQFKNSNRTCSKCLVLEMGPKSQKKKTLIDKINGKHFIIIIVLVLLGITTLGTSIVMNIHYSIKTENNPDLEFGEFFIANFFPDVIYGFFVGIIVVIIIVIIVIVAKIND